MPHACRMHAGPPVAGGVLPDLLLDVCHLAGTQVKGSLGGLAGNWIQLRSARAAEAPVRGEETRQSSGGAWQGSSHAADALPCLLPVDMRWLLRAQYLEVLRMLCTTTAARNVLR